MGRPQEQSGSTKSPPKKPSRPDWSRIQLGLDKDSPIGFPVVYTFLPQPDFPHCDGCFPGEERQILQAENQQDGRTILCPKSPIRLKCGQGDWTPVPSRLARECDGRGSAASLADLEARQKAKDQPPEEG